MKITKSIARRRLEIVAEPATRNNSTDPVSLVGMIAIFAAVTVFVFDYLTQAHAALGVVFVLALTLLSNESPKTIVLFGGSTAVMLLVKLIILTDVVADEVVQMEKIIGLVAISGITIGLVRHRTLEEKVNRLLDRQLNIVQHPASTGTQYVVKPECVIKVMKEIKERKATEKELHAYRKHRSKSRDTVDPYTRDLVKFIYSKSLRN